ncbi:MAG: enoyl-CoA hydratase/isomerase family protein, partial [Pseudomonadota bacterium]
ALNALTHEMVLEMERVLRRWAEDPAVALVIVDGAGERAFCAGGDIQKLYETGRAGDFAYGRRFWTDEYRLNALIAAYPKPYVAIMAGFVMGGGVGVSAHGSHRVVTETTQVAMPECGIGLIPDVGGSHLLARAEGHVGEYYGLTGARMSGMDAVLVNFADLKVDGRDLPRLVARLAETGDAERIYDFGTDDVRSELAAIEDVVSAHFSAPTVPEIVAQLAMDPDPWAVAAKKAIGRNSPLSLATALVAIRAAREEPGVVPALRREYRFVARCMERGDFLEGIRAAVIDKDRTPAWPDTLEMLDPGRVAEMLAPLGPAELDLGGG